MERTHNDGQTITIMMFLVEYHFQRDFIQSPEHCIAVMRHPLIGSKEEEEKNQLSQTETTMLTYIHIYIVIFLNKKF